MRSKMLPLVAFAIVLTATLISNNCSGPANCPTCGTDKNGTVGLIDVMLVPEHNPNGEPGGPFNIFDISWVDPTNRLYSVSDRIGLDVPVFSTTTNTALWAIGGQNSVAEAGNNTSVCWVNSEAGETIPPITTAQGNYTRYGCKTLNFRLPGFFGPNGNFGGFPGGQCCASRANNLNPLSGPNGLEVSSDGNFMFVGTGSSNVVVFDLRPMLTSNFTAPPLVTATVATGTSPDYDGPVGIGPCQASANGRAFADPTCGDLRADELATTGGVVSFPQDGSSRFLVAVINGDPGLPFVSIIDATPLVTTPPVNGNGTPATLQQQHCLPYSAQNPYSPGGPNTTFTANYSSCILGQIYYDNAAQNDITSFIDDGGANGPVVSPAFPCPDPSLEFNFPPGGTRVSVPTGASGHAAGFNPDVACHHGPQLTVTTATQAGGAFCPQQVNVPAGTCVGALAPAGLGGLAFYPPTHMFLMTNGNSTPDITVGSVDVIDPLHPVTVGETTRFVPVVVNSFPIPMCMPTSVSVGPGTDVLVGCADHDGRAFSPNTVIINGTTGQILTTINFVGAVDQTWYNPGDNRYYLAARDMPTGPVLGVIDAAKRQWLQNVPTNGNAHSVATDPINNHTYVPLPSGSSANCISAASDGCVGVYASE